MMQDFKKQLSYTPIATTKAFWMAMFQCTPSPEKKKPEYSVS